MWVTMHGPFFFFNDTATTEIYTLSLHDALPISRLVVGIAALACLLPTPVALADGEEVVVIYRSEEHTSELQSRLHLVCRLLLEKKKNQKPNLPAVREMPNIGNFERVLSYGIRLS